MGYILLSACIMHNPFMEILCMAYIAVDCLFPNSQMRYPIAIELG